MDKTTSKNNQDRADRLLPKDYMVGNETLTVEQRIELLKAALRKIDMQLLEAPKNSKLRKQLGANKARLSYELNALRGTKTKSPGIGQFFFESARRMLDRAQFNLILEDAHHIYNLRNQKKDEEAAIKRALELTKMEEKNANGEI